MTFLSTRVTYLSIQQDLAISALFANVSEQLYGHLLCLSGSSAPCSALLRQRLLSERKLSEDSAAHG